MPLKYYSVLFKADIVYFVNSMNLVKKTVSAKYFLFLFYVNVSLNLINYKSFKNF